MLTSGFKPTTTPYAIFLALALTACGGGGGGGEQDTGPNINLSGTATKGIIKNGNVIAKQQDANGDFTVEVGSATTLSDGSYSLNLESNYQGGPIEVTVTLGENSEMKCDVPPPPPPLHPPAVAPPLTPPPTPIPTARSISASGTNPASSPA